MNQIWEYIYRPFRWFKHSIYNHLAAILDKYPGKVKISFQENTSGWFRVQIIARITCTYDTYVALMPELKKIKPWLTSQIIFLNFDSSNEMDQK